MQINTLQSLHCFFVCEIFAVHDDRKKVSFLNLSFIRKIESPCTSIFGAYSSRAKNTEVAATPIIKPVATEAVKVH